MNEFLQLAIFMFALLFLLGTGVQIGISLIGAAFVGMVLFTNRPVGEVMATTMWGAATSWSLTALPLFIWMGEILIRSKLSSSLFRGLAPWTSGIPGGLLHENVLACGLFAAISGSSAATVATVGRMSIPELRSRGYREHHIIGTLAGAGTLGLLIPPSIILIIYGVSVNESIVRLFIAATIPGIILALMFMGSIAITAIVKPDDFPNETNDMSFLEKVKATSNLLPIFALIFAVLGSIYSGIATATEAAAMGVAGSLIIAGFQRSLSLKIVTESITSAIVTSSMIALLLVGSSFLALSMGFTGLPRLLADWIGSLHLSPVALIVALGVFFIILGCFLDGISIVVLTMAVIEPTVRQAGIDMIWFGVFLVIVVEMAQITPPVGFNLFILQGISGHEVPYIAKAALPMFLIMVVALAILIVFPEVTTSLPDFILN